MNKNMLVLLKAVGLSTSRINKLKNCKDKKTKGKVIGALVGVSFLYLMLVIYSLLLCMGYGLMGIGQHIPLICASIISLLALFFTFFKTNGYLFNFKEYDMLMSLPFEPKTIAAVKFLRMYISSLPWYLSISLSMMVGYAIYLKPAISVYIIWIALTFFVPIIPMLVATFIGFLIARISSGFRKKNIIQTVLSFAIVIFSFSLQYIIQAIIEGDKQKEVMETFSESLNNIGQVYRPVKWFSQAIVEVNFVSLLLLIVISALAFELVFAFIGRNYRKINSALKSHGASKAYKMKGQKKSSVLNAIAFKEYKRMMGSSIYMVNGSMGAVLAALLGIVVLVLGFDKIVSIVVKGAPVDASIVLPAIPLIVYFFVGMVATTAISPSIEGKNYWIMQSLPIPGKVIYQGKMLFNLYLFGPFAVFSTLCLCISAKADLLRVILYVIEIAALLLFSTTWGCVCGIKHMKLDWENEIEVVKQGAAVTIYLLPNLFVTMGLVVLVVFLGMHMNSNIVSVVISLIALVLAALSYKRAMTLAEKRA